MMPLTTSNCCVRRTIHTQFFCGGRLNSIHEGQIIVINPAEVHYGHAIGSEGWTYRIFYPGVSLLRKITASVTGKVMMPHFPSPVINDEKLAALMFDAHTLFEDKPSPESQQERDIALRMVLGELVARYAVHRPAIEQQHSEWQSIYRAREQLECHYAENITLEQLAQVAGFSPFHLLRLFSSQTGLPPHKYLMHVRIKQAKNMLSSGEQIKDVALATGFTDQSHLTRRFKSVVGVTPGQYARHVQM